MPSLPSVHLLSGHVPLSEDTAVILRARTCGRISGDRIWIIIAHVTKSPTFVYLKSQQEPLQWPSFFPRDRFDYDCLSIGAKHKSDHVVPGLKISE